MPRPIWTGHLRFGLVQIPVSLHSAEKRSDLQFHLLDSRDLARVRYERINEVTGAEVPWQEVVRGYEYDDDNLVVLKPEDFKRAAPEATQSVEIEDFVPAGAIPFPYFERPYFLVPERHGEKGYALLREAMRESRRIGVARVVIRTREHLAAILVDGPMLVLDLLRFPQEMRTPKDFGIDGASTSRASAKEHALARQLIQSMASPWKPAKYHDEYREKLLRWIEERAEKGPAPKEPLRKTPASKDMDMKGWLERSLGIRGRVRSKAPRRDARRKTGARRGASGKGAGKPANKRPRRRARA